MAMNFKLRLSAHAERDIAEVLLWTLERFGERQCEVYEALIRRAFEDVAQDPQIARARPEIHEQARTLHLARCGQRARHFFLLRIAPDGVVEVARLLHDAMDLSANLPPELDLEAP